MLTFLEVPGYGKAIKFLLFLKVQFGFPEFLGMCIFLVNLLSLKQAALETIGCTRWFPLGVLTIPSFVSFGVNDSRERLTKMEAATSFVVYLCHTPSLLFYSICPK